MVNTICGIKESDVRSISSFEGLAQMGKNHFHTLFKADQRANIADIIRLALHFPRFVDEEGNEDLFAKVGMEELKETLHSFQKDKSLGPDGWRIELYLGFF